MYYLVFSEGKHTTRLREAEPRLSNQEVYASAQKVLSELSQQGIHGKLYLVKGTFILDTSSEAEMRVYKAGEAALKPPLENPDIHIYVPDDSDEREILNSCRRNQVIAMRKDTLSDGFR